MEGLELSLRQILVLVFTALLVPAVALPGRLAETAGGLSWLVPILCIPAAVLLSWVLGKLGDLPTALGRAWGRFFGGALTLIYSIWLFALLVLFVHGLVGRLQCTGTKGFAPYLIAFAVLILVGVMARGGGAAFCRGIQLFFYVLAIFLGAVLLLGLFHVQGDNLWTAALPSQVMGGITPALSVLSLGTLGGFLVGQTPPLQGDDRRRLGWTVAFCVTLSLLALVVVGSLGAPLTGALPAPFFTVVQSLGVTGAFQRLEGPAAALWLLSDLALLGLLALALGRGGTALWGVTVGRRLVPTALAAALILGVLLGEPGAVALRPAAMALNLLLGFLLPCATLLVGHWKKC